jgi:hypothetical protein
MTHIRTISYITLLYLAVFAVVAFYTKNSEFFLYTITIGLIVLAGLKKEKSIRMNLFLPARVVVGISALGFLGLLGGVVNVKGTKLLDASIIAGLLKYQDIMHIMFMFVMVLTSYVFLKPYILSERMMRTRTGRVMLYLTVVLIVSGLGATIEVVEFIAATVANAQVGSYTSNALDLLFNLIGALLAILLLPIKREDDPVVKDN